MYCMICTNRVDKCRCNEGTLSEAQAEIERLQSELEIALARADAYEEEAGRIRDGVLNRFPHTQAVLGLIDKVDRLNVELVKERELSDSFGLCMNFSDLRVAQALYRKARGLSWTQTISSIKSC